MVATGIDGKRGLDMVTMFRLIAFGTVVCIVCGVSAKSFAKEKTALAMTQLVGAGLLLVVVFAHVCEVFGIIPSLGWGRPGTVGHYIDFFSAVAGSIVLALGYFGRRIMRTNFKLRQLRNSMKWTPRRLRSTRSGSGGGPKSIQLNLRR